MLIHLPTSTCHPPPSPGIPTLRKPRDSTSFSGPHRGSGYATSERTSPGVMITLMLPLGSWDIGPLCKILYSRAHKLFNYQRSFFQKNGAYLDTDNARRRTPLFYIEEKEYYSHIQVNNVIHNGSKWSNEMRRLKTTFCCRERKQSWSFNHKRCLTECDVLASIA